MTKAKKTVSIIFAAVIIIAAAGFLCFHFFGEQKTEVPLRLVSQPQNVVCEDGYSASFSVTANGDGLSYLWECFSSKGSWSKLNDKNTPSLLLAASKTMDGNLYRCTVTDKNGKSIISEAAELTVVSGHVFGDIVVTKAPTCLLGGEGMYICASCGAKSPEELPANGHDFDESVSYSGKRLYKCRVCSYTFETDLKDKEELEKALDSIPPYVGYYYNGSAADTLAKTEKELNAVVFGVKAVDRLSQREADSYTAALKEALSELSMKTGDTPRIYVSTNNGEETGENALECLVSVSDNNAVEKENVSAKISLFSDFYSESSYNVRFDFAQTLLGVSSQSYNLIARGDDRSCMRTYVAYKTAFLLGLEDCSDASLAELWINGNYIGLFTVTGSVEHENADPVLIDSVFGGTLSYAELIKKVDINSFINAYILANLFGLSSDCFGYSQLYSKNGVLFISVPNSFCLTSGNTANGAATAEDLFETNSYFSALGNYVEFRRETDRAVKKYEEDLSELYNQLLNSLPQSFTEMLLRSYTDTGTSVSDNPDRGFVAGDTVQSNIGYFYSCLCSSYKLLTGNTINSGQEL